jgi:phosphoribosylamine--glycine ligase
VEERLRGPEASVIALCDGEHAVALPAARDHKRLLDGDRGPNTGGMGAYSPLPDLDDTAVEEIVKHFHRPVLRELARRGTPFRGALYAGLMLTADGPRLLEFNARFGDPETQVLLPRLVVPLGPLLLAAAKGRLDEARTVATMPGAAVGIVLAAAGYPEAPRKGDRIDSAPELVQDVLVFHSGTRRQPDGSWETNGGRVLTVVGRGADLDAARASTERAADAIRFEGLQRRHDIGLTPIAVGSVA